MRDKVLSCYRLLHRTRKTVFAGDIEMLTAGRLKINEEFVKHKNETDSDEIFKLIKKGEEAAAYLQTHVVQAKLSPESGHYKVKFQKETHFETHVPYNENWVPEKQSRKNKTTDCSKDS